MWTFFSTALSVFLFLYPVSVLAAEAELPAELSFVEDPNAVLPSNTPSSGLAAHPVLRILFSGNTRGALFPCPT